MTSYKASFVRSFFYIVTIGVVRLTVFYELINEPYIFARMYILITTKINTNEFVYTHKYTHKIHVTTVILQKIRKKI